MRDLRTSITLLVSLMILLGGAYTGGVTLLAQLLFPSQAAGSLVIQEGTVYGSELIGQHFGGDRYFWGRPSATAAYPNNPTASGGSNLAQSNPALLERVQNQVVLLQKVHGDAPIPIDLVTSSASGLDPDISVPAALYQAQRVAKSRGIPLKSVISCIERARSGRVFAILGEPVVNVLRLNMMLDAEDTIK